MEILASTLKGLVKPIFRGTRNSNNKKKNRYIGVKEKISKIKIATKKGLQKRKKERKILEKKLWKE